MQRGVLGSVCALVVGIYAATAHSAFFLPSKSLTGADTYYNLLVQGFRAGQLNLKKDVPSGFAQLADPYDHTANAKYEVLDLSYYKGKLYLYYGVTPAVVLLWPYVALTGHYLSQKDAAVIFCLVGFLANVGLLCALWRRYFAEVHVALVAAGVLALGLVTYVPYLLARCDVYEVSISCGYAFTMLAVAGIWKALHHSSHRGRWLAGASLAYGLAVGARPSLLFGAAILLVPVAQAWRERLVASTRHERQRIGAVLLMAATVPITIIGLGLMLYNFLRFDNPFEFGWHYALAGTSQLGRQPFSLQNLWFNFRVYFLEPAHWSGQFPFVHGISVPPVPAGNMGVNEPFGILTNIPLVWLALAVPLAWRAGSTGACSALRMFLSAVTMLFGICAVTLLPYYAAASRFEVDFLPALVLLAVVGIFGLERALAGQRVWRYVVRWGWGLLLGFSLAFNLLAGVKRGAESRDHLAGVLFSQGRGPEAIAQYRRALWLNPDYAEAHYDLGVVFKQQGKVSEAIAQYEEALRLKPDYAEAHFEFGNLLIQQGKTAEAIAQYEAALRRKPDLAEAHNNLGLALWQTGKVPEAMAQFEQAVRLIEQALRLNPDYAEAHYYLGVVLKEQGKTPEAMAQFEQALRLKPNSAEAHFEVGNVLIRQGKVPEAIAQYEQAVRLKPDLAEAHNNLGLALWQTGKVPEAFGHLEQAVRFKADYADPYYNMGLVWMGVGEMPEAMAQFEQALRINPNYAEAHANLGAILAQMGRMPEAIGHLEQALRLKPDLAEAHNNLGNALLQLGRPQEAIAHYEQALRLNPNYADAKDNLATAQAAQAREVPSQK